MKYRYAYDHEGKIFTQAEWINSAIPHFIENPEEPPEAYILFLSTIWTEHLKARTIVLLDTQEQPLVKLRQELFNQAWQKNQARDFHFLIGCTHCHHVHDTEQDGIPNKVLNQCFRAFTKRITERPT